MGRFAELKQLTWVRVLTFLREPEAIFWVFVFPLVLAGVLGFAFRSAGVQPSQIAVVGEPIAEVLRETENVDVEVFEDRDAAWIQLRKAAVDALVEVDESWTPETPPKLTYDENRAEGETARLRVLRAIARAQGIEDPELELASMDERGSRYVDFLFPGLIGMNLMGTGMWGIGFAIADVRRRKFLRRLMVTPMRRSSFLLSFMLSRMVFLVLEVTVLTSFGVWILGVPFRGDALSFALINVMGALLFAGMGVLVVSRAKTIEGASGIMNLVMMPMWLASGVFFSYERFPDAFHPLLRLLPLSAVNDALRAVMIDGESILALGPELLIMTVWGIACFAIALKIFRWE